MEEEEEEAGTYVTDNEFMGLLFAHSVSQSVGQSLWPRPSLKPGRLQVTTARQRAGGGASAAVLQTADTCSSSVESRKTWRLATVQD